MKIVISGIFGFVFSYAVITGDVRYVAGMIGLFYYRWLIETNLPKGT